MRRPIPTATVPSRCPSCGNEVQHWHQFCRSCGARVASGAPPAAPLPPRGKAAAVPAYVPPPEYSQVGSDGQGGGSEPEEPVRPRVTVRVLDAATRDVVDATRLGLRMRGRELLANAEGTLFQFLDAGEPATLKGSDFSLEDDELEHLPWAFQLRPRKEGLDYEATLVVTRAEARKPAPQLEGASATCPACEEPCFAWQRFCGACGALRDREAQRATPPEIIRDGRSCSRCDLALVEGFRYCTGCGAFRPPRTKAR